MKALKRSILFVVIVIPISIALFLKFFGRNTYKLPVYFEESYPYLTGCNEAGPEALKSFGLHLQNSGKVNLILWEPECEKNLRSFNDQVRRVMANLEESKLVEFTIISSGKDSLAAREKLSIARCALLIGEINETNLQNWQCDGFMVMIDADLKIRGYYSATDFEDVDRLILEVNVMKTILPDEEK